MTKRILIIILTIFFVLPSIANAADWSDFDNIDNAWDGQKPITNKEFEQTMDALEARKKQVEEKKQQKLLKKFKGNSLHNDTSVNKEGFETQNPQQEDESGQLLNLPVVLFIQDKKIEQGFYQVLGEKNEEGVFLNLYQAYTLVAKIQLQETDDDFGESKLNFVKLLPFDNKRMKLIYGSIDFNGATLVDFVEP